MAKELLCYNRGCGNTYVLEENTSESCTYHPGEPFFHDAYKGWSCCNRRCIDFTEFLNMKGCVKGFHSNIKPVVTESAKPAKLIESTEAAEHPRPRPTRMKRPQLDSSMVDLAQELTPSLKKSSSNEIVQADVERKSCYNSSCSVKYIDRDVCPVCTYHPGEAIFHEGLKFWSCCKKKAMDFDEFLKQKGCTQGAHSWTPKAKVDCRFDWHQTATHVIATIYAKGYDPSSVTLQSNGAKLSVGIDLAVGRYQKDWILYGVINEKESVGQLMATKIEIKLKKAEPIKWTEFDLVRPPYPENDEKDREEDGVDAVDLADL